MTQTTDSDSQGQTEWVLCGRCRVRAKHQILRAVRWHQSYDDVCEWATHQIIQCGGCETISFRSLLSNSEECEYDEVGDQVPKEIEQLYPPRAERTLSDELYLGNSLYEIPEIVQAIYQETLAAVSQGLATLGGIGIRAVMEAVCQQRGIPGASLANRIDRLSEMGLTTKDGAEVLHRIRLLGNGAAHEMKAPHIEQIKAALSVIDHLLLGVYVLPRHAALLPQREPTEQGKTGGRA